MSDDARAGSPVQPVAAQMLPDDRQVSAGDFADRFRSEGARLVRVMHTDLYGKARSKQFPIRDVASLMEGVGYCKASLVESLEGVPLEGDGFPADVGYPDVIAVPDPDTVRTIPWEPDVLWLLADLVEDGRPSELCCRGALRGIIGRLAEAGFSAISAPEPEFYLLVPDPQGGRHVPYSSQTGMAYTAGLRADPLGVLGRIQRGMIDLGIQVSAAHREFSPGQFEVNMRHAPALAAADYGFLFKEAVKELAVHEGMMATFMPMPFAQHAGSSCHVHVSLWKDDGNCFDDGNGGVTDLCRSFMAGIAEHAPALTAFASPTVNSYKRTAAGGLAPTHVRVSGDDRESYLRVPGERGGATRVEVRGGDASANPYLLTGAILVAGLDGIERGLTPDDVTRELPHRLGLALDELERSTVMREGFGDELIRVFVALKRGECDRYASIVTDWEWEQYGFHA
jgi:glutamine synthetase